MMAVKIDIDPNGDEGFSFSPCFRKICGRVCCLNTALHIPPSVLTEEADHYDAGQGHQAHGDPGVVTGHEDDGDKKRVDMQI